MAHPGQASPSMTRRQGGTKHPSHTLRSPAPGYEPAGSNTTTYFNPSRKHRPAPATCSARSRRAPTASPNGRQRKSRRRGSRIGPADRATTSLNDRRATRLRMRVCPAVLSSWDGAQVAGELAVLDIADVDGPDPPHRRAGIGRERLGEWWGRLLDRLELHAQNAPVFAAEPGTHMPDVTQLTGRVVSAEHQRPKPTTRAS